MFHLTASKTRRLVGVASILSSLSLLFAAAVAAEPVKGGEELPEGPYPAHVAGNPGCSTFDLTEIVKLDSFGSSYTVGQVLVSGGVTVTITAIKGDGDTGEATAFDWTSESPVTAMIVKASNGSNVYVYDPAATSGSGVSVTGEDEITHGVSHISFCAGESGGDDTTTGGGDDTTTGGGDDTTTGGGDDTTTGGGDDTTTGGGDDTTTGGDDTTTGGDTTGGTDTEVGDEVIANEALAIPTASYAHSCDAGGATLTLANAGTLPTDFDVTVSRRPADNAEALVPVSSQTETVGAESSLPIFVPMDEDETLVFAIAAEGGTWQYEVTNDCVAVLGIQLTNPNTPDPAPEVQAVELAATGLNSTDLLLLAMLAFGLGAMALLSSEEIDPLAARA